EVEWLEDQQERGDDATRPPEQQLAEEVDHADAERCGRRDGEREGRLVEAEETGRERRGKPPGGTVGEIVWGNGPALKDAVDEVPEEDVVAQPEAAEVQQPERQAEGHQPEGESPVGSIGECRALSILCLLQHALGQSLPAVCR